LKDLRKDEINVAVAASLPNACDYCELSLITGPHLFCRRLDSRGRFQANSPELLDYANQHTILRCNMKQFIPRHVSFVAGFKGAIQQ
jgi:hypothetical protein